MSPVFTGYCNTEADNESKAKTPAPQRAGYINTFGRETVIDSALTSALQAPVKVSDVTTKFDAYLFFCVQPTQVFRAYFSKRRNYGRNAKPQSLFLI